MKYSLSSREIPLALASGSGYISSYILRYNTDTIFEIIIYTYSKKDPKTEHGYPRTGHHIATTVLTKLSPHFLSMITPKIQVKIAKSGGRLHYIDKLF